MEKKHSTKSINEQLVEAKSLVENKLKHHFGLGKLEYCLVKKIEIEKQVLYPTPNINYELKVQVTNEYLQDIKPENTKETEVRLLNGYKEMANKLFSIFPKGKLTSTESYINEYREYLPYEHRMLLRKYGLDKINEITFEDVVDAINGSIEIMNFYDEKIRETCNELSITNDKIDEITDSYGPKIEWKASTGVLAELYYTLIRQGWIGEKFPTTPKTANFLRYHFHIKDIVTGKEASHATIIKAVNKGIKDIGNAKLIEIEKNDKLRFRPNEPIKANTKPL
jgi:hypothetical protein